MLVYPVAVIDFEASSLEHDSYPIEVGVAIAAGVDQPIRTWSTLIRPTSSWLSAGHWSRVSQRIHGLSREALVDGAYVRDAMAHLNTLLAPVGRAYCDGGDFDRYWLARLAGAAHVTPSFELRDLGGTSQAMVKSLQAILNASPTPHRAGPDAERLLSAIFEVYSLASFDRESL